MADVFSRPKRSQIMSQIKCSGTKPEQKVMNLLSEIGLSFNQNVKRLPGQPDFVLEENRVVIFVHGCFWHSHSNCKRARLPKSNKEFWESKISKNKSRDLRVARKLRSDGWKVYTIWQCRLKNVDRVKRFEGALAEE